MRYDKIPDDIVSICEKEVIYQTSLSRASVRRFLDEMKDMGFAEIPSTADALFPIPVKQPNKRIVWFQHEVHNWLVSRPRKVAGLTHPTCGKLPLRVIGLKEVARITKVPRSTIYKLLDRMRESGDYLFPVPIELSVSRIGFFDHEVKAWLASRPRVITIPTPVPAASNGEPEVDTTR